MKTITKLRRSVKAISPIISVLLMIAIAVSASLVAYAWVSGYMDFTTTKVGKSIQIQSISSATVYVQNVGESDVEIADLYVDAVLEAEDIGTTLIPGATATIPLSPSVPREGNQVTIKIVTTDGISAQYTKTFAGASPSSPVVTHTITASAGTGGSISQSGPVSVVQGNDATFAFTPDTDYHVADVVVDGSSVGAASSYTFTNVVADHTISATFAIDTFTITASAGAGGSISPSGAVTVDYGDDQGFTISANTNYHIVDVVVDSVSQGAITSYTFNDVTANHAISATFAGDAQTMTLRPTGGGSVEQLDEDYNNLANWQCVDESSSDDDSTYVYDGDDDGYDTDTYHLPNHGSTSGTINSVTVYINCRKFGTDSETSYARTALRSGSTVYYGTANALPSSGQWTTYSTTYNTNPSGGGSWTWSTIDSLQAGVSLDSHDVSGSYSSLSIAICTQVWVVVNYTP